MMIKIIITFILLASATNAQDFNEIRNKINNALSRLPESTVKSILIYNPLVQDTIFVYDHTRSMIPASNTKLFTTAVALSIMGGSYILSTQILTDDINPNDGVIHGNLYIKGLGNPIFTSSDLSDMVRELRNKGIRSITGNIIGDDTFFDDVYTRSDWIGDEAANIKLPPISALVIDRNRKVTYKKRGRRKRAYVVSIDNPPLNAAQMLRDKLFEEGITINGKPMSGITPANGKVLCESEVYLKEILNLVNKNSDNFLAECLFKTIGAVSSGKQGNSFYSTQAILQFIAENGVYSDGTSVVDGSGISRFDQITTGAIVGLLEKMYFDMKNYNDYYNSLSVASVDGTLRGRFSGTSAAGNFHGKTGTLNGVTSLSGYLKTASGEDLIVSMIFEYSRGGSRLHKRIENDIIQILTDWNDYSTLETN